MGVRGNPNYSKSAYTSFPFSHIRLWIHRQFFRQIKRVLVLVSPLIFFSIRPSTDLSNMSQISLAYTEHTATFLFTCQQSNYEYERISVGTLFCIFPFTRWHKGAPILNFVLQLFWLALRATLAKAASVVHTHTHTEVLAEFSLLITLICAETTGRHVILSHIIICAYGCQHVLTLKHRAKVKVTENKKRQTCL